MGLVVGGPEVRIMVKEDGPLDLVTIEVAEPISDSLQRIALLNGALLRTLTGTTLVRVLEADYSERGRIRLLCEPLPSHPRMMGRVVVSYEATTFESRVELNEEADRLEGRD